MQLGEPKDSLSTIAEIIVRFLEDFLPMLIFGHRFSMHKDMSAHLPYFFRCALSEETQIRVFSFVPVDGVCKFVDRTE